MRVAKFGMAFNYEPTTQTTIETGEIIYPDKFLKQRCKDFTLINYYIKEKRFYAQNIMGFNNIEKQLYIEMFLIDNNPRKYIYDNYSDAIYKVLDTPINVNFDTIQRKMYEIPISLLNTSEIRIDKEFIVNKFNELKGLINATI